MAQATSSRINVGTLAVDFFSPKVKQLVWRGEATKTLEPSKDSRKNQEKINNSVAKLLKEFLPKSKK